MTILHGPLGRPPMLRHTNAVRILHLLRDAGACSKADLVRASGLSAPTVANVVAYLQAADLIKAAGEGESSGGRPPDLIRFKAERGCVAAVDISVTSITILLADLDGELQATEEVLLEGQSTTPKHICALIGRHVRRMLRAQTYPDAELVGVTVGVPAITNVMEGVVLAISPLDGWHDVPLRSMLEKIFSCSVLVENDTNLAAQGERYRGAALGEENFVYISIGHGVGAGIMLAGRIHHGTHWSAGEIGYLRVPNVSARHTLIREFGELEKLIGSGGIEASWREMKLAGGAATKKLKAAAILDLAARNDEDARRIVEARAELVADLILNVSLILNPGLVILGGDIGSHPVLIEAVRTGLVANEFAAPRIAPGQLARNAVLWGGVELSLNAGLATLIESAAANTHEAS
ncbi:ROK family transcriptional regulator [Acidipila sp. EB88]|uniref:ROK family transcriptional regulator n=1 Tax=Acidipila sp. EB88 TaxID=2305226 RepID=UPI000F5FC53C|nr:ROK family transcriptional regulator [Acidipila sp. EB88]RRA47647.1 ROK family transcriptional regulator [Acidipila sp. EB88]